MCFIHQLTVSWASSTVNTAWWLPSRNELASCKNAICTSPARRRQKTSAALSGKYRKGKSSTSRLVRASSSWREVFGAEQPVGCSAFLELDLQDWCPPIVSSQYETSR